MDHIDNDWESVSFPMTFNKVGTGKAQVSSDVCAKQREATENFNENENQIFTLAPPCTRLHNSGTSSISKYP